MCGSSSFTGYWENLLWEEAWDGTGLGLAKTRGWDIVMALSLVFSIVYYCREEMCLLHTVCYTTDTSYRHFSFLPEIVTSNHDFSSKNKLWIRNVQQGGIIIIFSLHKGFYDFDLIFKNKNIKE